MPRTANGVNPRPQITVAISPEERKALEDLARTLGVSSIGGLIKQALVYWLRDVVRQAEEEGEK